MAVKKRFPYRAAFVACNGGCRADCPYGCIACGACVRKCPQGIISLHDCANSIAVKCANKAAGKEARSQCEVSCIGCGICEKICTAGAIKVTDNLSVIDERYCLSCGQCAVKCPRHAIYDLRGVLTEKR